MQIITVCARKTECSQIRRIESPLKSDILYERLGIQIQIDEISNFQMSINNILYQ